VQRVGVDVEHVRFLDQVHVAVERVRPEDGSVGVGVGVPLAAELNLARPGKGVVRHVHDVPKIEIERYTVDNLSDLPLHVG